MTSQNDKQEDNIELYLSELAPELLLSILDFVDIQDLLTISLVSKQVRSFFRLRNATENV